MPRRAHRNPLRCQVVTRHGLPCGQSVPEGQQYSCSAHGHYERYFTTPQICEMCWEPIPVTTNMSTVCSTACRHRRTTEAQGGYSVGPECARCGDWRTYYINGPHYVCTTCGYCSDLPDRIYPGQLTRKKSALPAGIEVAEGLRKSPWRLDLQAERGKDERI